MSAFRSLRAAAALLLSLFATGLAPAAEDAARYVQFVEDFSGTCSARSAKLLLVRNAHPTRTLKVWLDRYHMGSGTGDRSRSELAPNGAPEALGCSRSTDGPQEWRVVRAQFVD